jgi:hypothetical protein
MNSPYWAIMKIGWRHGPNVSQSKWRWKESCWRRPRDGTESTVYGNWLQYLTGLLNDD